MNTSKFKFTTTHSIIPLMELSQRPLTTLIASTDVQPPFHYFNYVYIHFLIRMCFSRYTVVQYLKESDYFLARMLNKKSRVTVHAKLTAVSSKPIGPDKIHPLSALDHAMGAHTLHMVFYYKNNPFWSFDLNPLRESLAELLSMYPPVTGRLTRNKDGNWEVKCNDAGVRVLRSNVDATLDEWLRSADGSEERDLATWEDMPENPNVWAPFRVQINEFEGGSVGIGLSCPHMLADPTCLTLIFKSWAETHQLKPIDHPPFFHPSAFLARPLPNTKTDSANYYAAKSKAQPPLLKIATATATATFKFSNSTIENCLSQVHENCPKASPFDFLTALFSTRIAHFANDPKLSLTICIDSRKLMHEPLPDGYFGNALHFSPLSLDDTRELGHVVESVHSHVANIEAEEVSSAIDWFESQKQEGGKYCPSFRMYGPELTFVGIDHSLIRPRHSLIYGAMFDKEFKPLHVSCHVGNVEGEGLVMVMPSAEEGLARTVMVTLPEDVVEKLLKDEAILRLEPTVLLSGGR